MATHSSIRAWRIPWAEEPGGLQLWGCKELDMTERQSMWPQNWLIAVVGGSSLVAVCVLLIVEASLVAESGF